MESSDNPHFIKPVYPDREDRLRTLIRLEIQRIVDDLDVREDWLIELWGRHRDRGPFLDTIFSRWKTVPMSDLALLDAETLIHVEEFYRELEDMRLFLCFTQDMPTTLAQNLRLARKRLTRISEFALGALGGELQRPDYGLEELEEVPLPSPARPQEHVSEIDAGAPAAPEDDEPSEPNEGNL